MPIDMSGPIRASADKRLAEAMKAEAEGDRKKAAKAFRLCAELTRQLAQMVATPAIKKQRLEKAAFYEEKARYALAGKKPQYAVAETGASPEDEDQGKLDSAIQSLIFKSSVTWDDIGGLDSVKQVFKSAYALALAMQPEGVRLPPWRAILLFGPPGTGKTMLAAAASNGLGATFFNIRVSSILSKYFGESTKLIGTLYDAAREKAPSVVYIDEFESVGSATQEGSGPEGRILATLRVELDGLALKEDPRYVLTLASTNEPWKLDRPIVDRFKKRIYVPLPDMTGRQAILNKVIQKHGLTSELPAAELARMTEGYSGRELDAFSQEAISLMVKEMNPELEGVVDKGLDAVKQYTIKVSPLKKAHLMEALSHIKPKVSREHLRRFEEWEKSLE